MTLSKLRGQVVVINFWASWCTECQTEQAALNQTWQQFQDSGVVVLGINFEDSTGAARDYVRSDSVSYPVVEDAASRTALSYGLRGVPETFVVNRSGRIVNRVIGPVIPPRSATRSARCCRVPGERGGRAGAGGGPGAGAVRGTGGWGSWSRGWSCCSRWPRRWPRWPWWP